MSGGWRLVVTKQPEAVETPAKDGWIVGGSCEDIGPICFWEAGSAKKRVSTKWTLGYKAVTRNGKQGNAGQAKDMNSAGRL